MTSAQPESTPQKKSIKLKLRGILQNNFSALFKNVSVMKYKERPRNCSSLKETKETMVFPGGSVVKDLPVNAEDTGLIPGLGRSPGVGKGYPLQYSCLKNSVDRRA